MVNLLVIVIKKKLDLLDDFCRVGGEYPIIELQQFKISLVALYELYGTLSLFQNLQ